MFYQKVFSLNTISNREPNLKFIIPSILKQADYLHINLIGYNYIPKILKKKKILINQTKIGGSELRFLPYHIYPGNTYFFPIDDDILYPDDYSNVLIKNMLMYGNEAICCVHGSDINLNQNKDYYKIGKRTKHFSKKLDINTQVLIPGVGTSCFFKKTFNIDINEFKTPNMSDAYIGSFAFKQKIPVISIERKAKWLKLLPEYKTSIWGNNPHSDIDELINKTFK